MKKTLSLIIALAMILTMLPMTIASAEAEQAIVTIGKPITFVGTTYSKPEKIVDGYTGANAMADWVLLGNNAAAYMYIDLGKEYDLNSLNYLGRNSGEANGERRLYLSTELLAAAPTADTADLVLTIPEGTGNGTITFDAPKTARYIYLDAETHLGIYEIEAYADVKADAVNLSQGIAGVDNYGKSVTWVTDGNHHQYYNKYGENHDANTGIVNGEWYKFDLGAAMDVEYFYVCNALAGGYQQGGLQILAGKEDDMSKATVILPGTKNKDCGPTLGRKIAYSGKFRYVWLTCAEVGQAYVDDLRVFGYDNRETVKTTFTNLTDGAQNVTNIANLAKHVYGDGSYDNLTTITEPIWVQFTDNVDMQTVSASTVKVLKGTSAVSYSPVIDSKNNRLGVDIADLAPNTTYTIQVTDAVKSTDNLAATPATLTFETHVPAKIRYKEGREILNVAVNAKTKIVGDNSQSPTPAITDIYRWTNGVMGAEAFDNMALATAGDPAPYAIIDLGDTYHIMGQATVAPSNAWQARYFQFNVLQSEDEALSDSNLLERVGDTYHTGYCQSTAEDATGRYIALKSLGQDSLSDGKGHLKLQEILILTQTVPNPVSQAKATRIEIENYADEFAAAFGEATYEDGLGNYANPTQPVGKVKFTDTGKNFSGNYAMMGKKSTDDVKKFSIPVTVTEGGYYNAEYRIGGAIGMTGYAWLDADLVAADGTKYSLSNGMTRAHEAGTSSASTQKAINDGGSRYTWKITAAPAKIPAGDYNLEFTINGSTFVFDYIEIKPIAATPAGTKLESDSMAINTATYEGVASNDTIQYTSWGYDNKAQNVYAYPVTIAEDGKYSIETVMAYANSSLVSRIAVLVDGKQVYKNNALGTDVSLRDAEGKAQFVSNDFAMNKYTAAVDLTAGEHEIKYVIDKSTDTSASNLYKFAIDYTLVTPYVANPISQAKATRIEIEDYANEFAAAFGQDSYDAPAKSYSLPTDSAVAKYIPTTTVVSNDAAMWAKAIEEDTFFEIPVTITEAGAYQAKLRIGAAGVNSGQAASAYIVMVAEDGTEYELGGGAIADLQYAGGYADGYAKQALEPEVYASGAGIFSAYTGAQYLPEGKYTAKVMIPAGKYSYSTFKEVVNPETQEKEEEEEVHNINKPIVLDYIEFSAAEIAQTGTAIDAEDYINVKKFDIAAAADGIIEYTGWSYNTANTITYTIPVNVTEKGYYDVEALMHHAPSGDTSNIVISVDGTVAYNNKSTGRDLSNEYDVEGDPNFKKWFPVNEYKGNKIYLEAGVKTISITMKRTFDNAYKFAIDYIKITKSQDEMFIDGNEVVIKANYGKTVSGDAYMAFYKGDKLVEVKEAGSVGTAEIEVGAVPPTDEYDYVKLLVWGAELLPSVYAIGFNN